MSFNAKSPSEVSSVFFDARLLAGFRSDEDACLLVLALFFPVEPGLLDAGISLGTKTTKRAGT